MSAICGLINLDQKPVYLEHMTKMMSPMTCYGPDDSDAGSFGFRVYLDALQKNGLRDYIRCGRRNLLRVQRICNQAHQPGQLCNGNVASRYAVACSYSVRRRAVA